LQKHDHSDDSVEFRASRLSLESQSLLRPLPVDPTPVLGRLDVHELQFDDAFAHSEQLDPQRLQPRRQRSHGPAEFAIILIVYADATVEKCALYGHGEGEQPFNDEKERTDLNLGS
jgi:hypothetical protein